MSNHREAASDHTTTATTNGPPTISSRPPPLLAPTTPAVGPRQPQPRNTAAANSGSRTANHRRSRRGADPGRSNTAQAATTTTLDKIPISVSAPELIVNG